MFKTTLKCFSNLLLKQLPYFAFILFSVWSKEVILPRTRWVPHGHIVHRLVGALLPHEVCNDVPDHRRLPLGVAVQHRHLHDKVLYCD